MPSDGPSLVFFGGGEGSLPQAPGVPGVPCHPGWGVGIPPSPRGFDAGSRSILANGLIGPGGPASAATVAGGQDSGIWSWPRRSLRVNPLINIRIGGGIGTPLRPRRGGNTHLNIRVRPGPISGPARPKFPPLRVPPPLPGPIWAHLPGGGGSGPLRWRRAAALMQIRIFPPHHNYHCLCPADLSPGQPGPQGVDLSLSVFANFG